MKKVEIDEILRYMGHRGEADEALLSMVHRCAGQMSEAAQPRHVSAPFPLEFLGEGAVRFAGIRVESRDLAAHLKKGIPSLEGMPSQKGGQVILFAATLGAQADRLISREGAKSISHALCLDACATFLLESYCDNVEAGFWENGGACAAASRFSPGYGDFDIGCQAGILKALEAGKAIGLFETDGHMLAPQKSITAVIGLGAPGKGPQKCRGCAMLNCPFRKE